MRVVMLDTCVLTDWRVLRAGEVYELPDDLASSLTRSGVARAQAPIEITTIAPTETATLKKRRRRDA